MVPSQAGEKTSTKFSTLCDDTTILDRVGMALEKMEVSAYVASPVVELEHGAKQESKK